MTPYRDLEQYIEKLEEVFKVVSNFKSLKHHYNNEDGRDYLLMTTKVGNVFMFDITNASKAQVLHIVSQIICGEKPKELVEDQKKLLWLGQKFA